MKNLGLLFLGVILALLLGLLGTKAILSVSTLFGLSFIAELGFLKIYGLASIINLLLFKDTDFEDEDKTTDEKVKNIYNRILNKTLVVLIFWGMSFLMFNILS